VTYTCQSHSSTLCHQEPDVNEKFKTTAQDLEGFWDMVLLQVDDVYSMFTEIETLRRNDWVYTEDTTPVRHAGVCVWFVCVRVHVYVLQVIYVTSCAKC